MVDVSQRASMMGRTALGVMVAAAVGLAAAPAALARTANVNFVGTWTPNTGVAWTITHENRATGACTGYSALRKSGYGLVGCHVSGHHYRFTITYGSSYRSVNTGTIHGRRLTGSFDDGSVNPYTATRTRR